jgi:FkbM family methyltransferase
MLEHVIPRILASVPVTWRRAVIGRPDNPSRLATILHNLLNRKQLDSAQVFDCRGALEGYRMSIDWNRFRSFVYGSWEPDVVNVVATQVGPGETVIDIGAHIGYYTLLFAKCVGETGQVVSFEPLPANFVLLQKNAELNHLEQVRVIEMAVFSRTAELVISASDDMANPGDASVLSPKSEKTFQVSAITLDAFVAKAGLKPDFIKMDVEGAEHDVLVGARETIAKYRPKMLIELHHFDGNVAGHPVPSLLADMHYEVGWIDRAHMTSHIFAVPQNDMNGIRENVWAPSNP